MEQLNQGISGLEENQDYGLRDVIPDLDIATSISEVTACLVCTSAQKSDVIRNLNIMLSRVASAEQHGFADAETSWNILKETRAMLVGLTTDLGKQRPYGLSINATARQLFLLEFTRAADYDVEFVQRVNSAKANRYLRTVAELRKVLPGWEIEIPSDTLLHGGSSRHRSAKITSNRIWVS